jgi:ligand-binding sensor domain-containing protein
VAAIAAAQPAKLPEKQYTFIHYSASSGLVSNQVNTVLQDEDGFIWIGTSDGLQRYDGSRYITFRHSPSDPASIPSNIVQQLVMDKEKNIWLICPGGLIGIFDKKKFTYRAAGIKPRKVKTTLESAQKICTDDEGNVFIPYGGLEVLTWNKVTNKFTAVNNIFKQKEEWSLTDFAPQPGTQKYWMGIKGAGIAIYNKATGNLNYPGHNTDNEPVIDQFKDLTNCFSFFFDRKGRVWFVSWKSGVPLIYCYDLKNKTPELTGGEVNSYLRHYHTVDGFFEQEDGTIWIRGMPVLAKYMEDEKRFQFVKNGYYNEQSIAYEIVTKLMEDREKNIWVCTDNNGLYRFNPASEYFLNVSHMNRQISRPGDGDPMSFINTKWGTILCGVWGNGIYHYDNNFNPIPTNIKGIDNNMGPTVWSMCASADSNTIWMAAQPGIWKLNQASRSATLYNPPLIENNTVRQVAEDKYGNLWVGMHGQGVYKWESANGSKNFNDGLVKYPLIPDGIVGRIYIDSKGLVWITCGNYGVYVIDPLTNAILLHFTEKAQGARHLPEPGVSTVLEYDDSTMLIATATYILLYNRVANKTEFVTNSGNLSGFIAAMEKDQFGNIWVSTTSGLYRANIRKKVFVRFGTIDGIASEHFMHVASRRLQDGRLLFGTSKQFIVFDPAAIRFNTSPPDLKITGFKAENKALLVDSLLHLKLVELGYRNNSLSITFSTLNFSSAYAIKYKLDGIDKAWKIADKTNEAVYSYLPPGNYTFLLKTIDEEGNESKETVSLKIKIDPPFWKTWWFYGLVALAAGGLLFWFDRERMKRKESIHRMRSNIADDLHEEVNTALGNINILSEMARLKADTEPEKSKEFIEQIHNRSHTMMIAMDDILWSISPENDSTEKLMLRLKEYVDALRNRHAVSIDLLVDEKVKTLELNMKQRKDIFWLFKGGITSVVNTGGANCRIHITLEKPHLVYTLEFDTANMDMQQLNNLRQRKELADKLKEANATLEVQAHKTNSLFVLQIPVA